MKTHALHEYYVRNHSAYVTLLMYGIFQTNFLDVARFYDDTDTLPTNSVSQINKKCSQAAGGVSAKACSVKMF